MNVRPTSTPNAGASDAAALRRAPDTTGERKEGTRAPGDERRGDVVELSAEARELLGLRETPAAEVPSSEISPERMRVILARLAEGFYERPDVQDRILGRIATDLERS